MWHPVTVKSTIYRSHTHRKQRCIHRWHSLFHHLTERDWPWLGQRRIFVYTLLHAQSVHVTISRRGQKQFRTLLLIPVAMRPSVKDKPKICFSIFNISNCMTIKLHSVNHFVYLLVSKCSSPPQWLQIRQTVLVLSIWTQIARMGPFVGRG